LLNRKSYLNRLVAKRRAVLLSAVCLKCDAGEIPERSRHIESSGTCPANQLELIHAMQIEQFPYSGPIDHSLD
jgi:hypothetical protein